MNHADNGKTFWDWIDDNFWWAVLFGLPTLGGVLAHLANWPPTELIELTAVLAVAAIIAIGLLFWRHIRLAEAQAALKQSMLQRGLKPDEIERLLSTDSEPPEPPLTDEQSIEQMAACLHQSGISEKIIEEVFAAVRAAEPSMRQSICHAIQGLSGEEGNEADEKEILAAIRGLSGHGSQPADISPPPVGNRSAIPSTLR